MKKLFTICIGILCILFCTSCTAHVNDAKEDAKNISGNCGMIREVYHYEYNGHQYISFESHVRDAGFSVIHDPDCKCNER